MGRVRWLSEQLDELEALPVGTIPVPVKVGRKRFLWNTTPLHADGSSFASAYETEVPRPGEGMAVVEANWSRGYALDIVSKMLRSYSYVVDDGTDKADEATIQGE
jgi:hypothetical protein